MTPPTTRELLDGRGRELLKAALAGDRDVPVSRDSMWVDPSWTLNVGPEVTVKVDFRDLPGSFATAARATVWLAMMPRDGQRKRKANTIAAIGTEFPRVFGFLSTVLKQTVGHDRDGLDAVSPAHWEAFNGTVLSLVGTPDAPSGATAERFFGVWSLLGQLRHEMRDAGVGALDFDPIGERSLLSLAKPFSRGKAPGPPALTDAVAALVATSAEDFLDRGDEVVEFQKAILAAIERDGGDAGANMVDVVRTFPWSPGPDGVRPDWNDCPRWDLKRAAAIARIMVEVTIGACCLVVHQEMGLRSSELEGLRGGRNPDTGLPRCLEQTIVGPVTLYLLDGLCFKRRDEEGEPAVWTAGMIGTGSNRYPPAVTALDLLDRLCAPWRRTADGAEPLVVMFQLRKRREDREAPVKGRVGGGIRIRIGQFLDRHVPWERLALDSESARYLNGNRPTISSRVLRKTLVNYAMRLDGSLLGALRAELHHSSDEETDVGYMTNDPKLIERAGDFASLEVSRIMLESAGDEARPARPGEAALAPHLADVRAIMAATQPSEWLERAASLASARMLAAPRVPLALLPDEHAALKAPALLARYRASRRAVLEGEFLGLIGEYAAIEAQAERAKAALAAMGVDVPDDDEISREEVNTWARVMRPSPNASATAKSRASRGRRP